jgi:hypothetical protein
MEEACPKLAAPEQALSIVGNDDLAGTASEVRRRLCAVVERAARG